MQKNWQNWAKNLSKQVSHFSQPASMAELVDRLCQSEQQGQRIQTVGSGHSSADLLFQSPADYFDLSKLNKAIDCSASQQSITVEAGRCLRDIDILAHQHGMSLANLGTQAVQSIAGAISTATHGSSLKYGHLSAQVDDMQLFTTNDCQLHWASELNILPAARVALGSLGVITAVTLKLVPQRYLNLVQHTIDDEELSANLDQYLQDNDYVKFLYVPDVDRYVLWLANYTDDVPSPTWQHTLARYWQGQLLANNLHELLLLLSNYQLLSLPTINRWLYRLLYQKPVNSTDLSYQIFNIPITIRQQVMELSFHLDDTRAVLKKLQHLCQQKAIHQPVEIRFIQADDAWLSSAYQQDRCCLNFVAYKPFSTAVDAQSVFQFFEQGLQEFSPRPHWAKYFTLEQYDFHQLYPKLADFLTLQQTLNPSASLRHPLIDALAKD